MALFDLQYVSLNFSSAQRILKENADKQAT